MSPTRDRTECSDCGAPIDASADAEDVRVPCPACGSVKRTAYLSLGPLRPSDYLLDNFVVHKLSLLGECGARELPPQEPWLSNFILNTSFRVGLPAKTRAYLFNFLRRAEGALSAYREARAALIEYIETPRNVFSPYFRSLLNFEVCISQCYQGYELLATAAGEKLFEKGDGSVAEKLERLYVDSKHMDHMIDGGKIPTNATTAVWITNQGLESSRSALSFDELVELLNDMSRRAERLSALEPPR